MENKNDVCVICGGNGANNNAEPVAAGCCCDACNSEVVAARAEAYKQGIMADYLRHMEIAAEAKETIYNMVSVLMSDEFKEWMIDNWNIISELEEFCDIMWLYLKNDTEY